MYAETLEPRIATERLLLRPPTPGDAVYIAELANDVDVARMTTAIRHPYRLSDAECFLAAMAAADPREDQPLLIEHPEVGPIGMTGFHRHAEGVAMELGYWLGRTFRGRGFATEAVRAAVGWAEHGLGRRVLISSHFADNPASARVLEKAGFLYTGEVGRRFSLGPRARGQHAHDGVAGLAWLQQIRPDQPGSAHPGACRDPESQAHGSMSFSQTLQDRVLRSGSRHSPG